MTNTLKDTMTTVKAELLGYKYITDFDYNSLLEMKVDYMNKKDKTEWSNVIRRALSVLSISKLLLVRASCRNSLEGFSTIKHVSSFLNLCL